MTDHVTNVHNVFFTASYLPMEKLTVNGTVVYNQSKASMDPIHMPDVTDRLDGELEHMDYDFKEAHTYSDLEYALWRLTLGMDYRVSPLWWFMVEGEYAHLKDNAAYVYGDRTGSFVIGRAGARFIF